MSNGRKTFSKNVKTQVFDKVALPINKNWGIDFRGKKIARAGYGDENSKFGWNIHHKDGNKNNNNIDNLIPVHYDTHRDIHR